MSRTYLPGRSSPGRPLAKGFGLVPDREPARLDGVRVPAGTVALVRGCRGGGARGLRPWSAPWSAPRSSRPPAARRAHRALPSCPAGARGPGHEEAPRSGGAAALVRRRGGLLSAAREGAGRRSARGEDTARPGGPCRARVPGWAGATERASPAPFRELTRGMVLGHGPGRVRRGRRAADDLAGAPRRGPRRAARDGAAGRCPGVRVDLRHRRSARWPSRAPVPGGRAWWPSRPSRGSPTAPCPATPRRATSTSA